jgi:DNA invertase Pin-like site-specific DNA recombinase
MCHIIASVAQYETELRAERVMAGQQAARAAGKTWGGSEAGWRRKATAEKADLVRRLHSEGQPIAKIARTVGLSRPTIYSIVGQ